MADLGPKNKHKVSGKSLANLRPNPQHMKPHGGKQARQYVGSPELEFLNYVLDGANHTDAARRAGLSKGINLTSLMKLPIIDQTFAELQEKAQKPIGRDGRTVREERSVFAHQEIMHRLRTAETLGRWLWRARIVISLILLMAVFSGLAGAQVVVTDDANTGVEPMIFTHR
jgi:hypothetical protein